MGNERKPPPFRLAVLGARGSVPREGEAFARYGGATSCYRVRAGGEEIYLDAGSGIAAAVPDTAANITILLTHMHLDHLVGLPFFAALGEAGRAVDIYAAPRAGLAPGEAIDRLVSPPFWPCTASDYPAAVRVHALPSGTFFVGDVRIDTMEGVHPGGSTIYRLAYRGKSLVYATDFEHSPPGCEALASFASGCDLLLYDAQYTEAEYESYRGYGHSTPAAGIGIAAACGAARLLFVHHAPWRSDGAIIAMGRELSGRHGNIQFAAAGDEIVLCV